MPWGRGPCVPARSVQQLHTPTEKPVAWTGWSCQCAIFVSQTHIPSVVAPPGFRDITSQVPQSFGKALTGITALGSGVNPTRRHRLFNLRTRLCQLTEGFAWCHCNIKKWVRHGDSPPFGISVGKRIRGRLSCWKQVSVRQYVLRNVTVAAWAGTWPGTISRRCPSRSAGRHKARVLPPELSPRLAPLRPARTVVHLSSPRASSLGYGGSSEPCECGMSTPS